MNIFAISGLVNGIVAITFGILVISKNCRDRANQIFFFMTLSLAVWAFSYWQWLLSTNYDDYTTFKPVMRMKNLTPEEVEVQRLRILREVSLRNF